MAWFHHGAGRMPARKRSHSTSLSGSSQCGEKRLCLVIHERKATRDGRRRQAWQRGGRPLPTRCLDDGKNGALSATEQLTYF
ncbi:hypothetical protein L497_0869 [Bordetella holmesii CDC-H585-BH]|uniref:Uncharacterized protein n=1 Tax=Bordetella holmesii CDC-H585-BH TaxID=1331206 RepID=A0A158LZX6_9BORD|nr:hypothetical protein L497_0869 [Bordetella holmesii CDC-H585-BH]